MGKILTFSGIVDHTNDKLRFTTAETGLPFLAIALGILLGGATAVLCDHLLFQPEYKRTTEVLLRIPAPEVRLYISMIGSFGVPIGLFWFAWTANRDIHWVSCVLATIPFAWGNISIFVSFLDQSVRISSNR